MADPTEIETGLNDADLFRSSTAPEPAPASDTGGQGAEPPPPPPQQERQQEGQPRDERGRFASSQAAETPPAAPPPTAAQPGAPPAEPDAQVPSWRLREEREAREAAQRRADEAERNYIRMQQHLDEQRRQQQQQQPPAIDPLADPAGFIALMRAERERERLEDRLQFSMERAHEKHGTVFEEAYNAFIATAPGNQMWAQSVLKRPNPGHEIVSWYQKERAFKEYGADPAAYRTKLEGDLLKDPQFLAKAIEAARSAASGQNGSRPQNVTQMPVSLSRVPGGGSTAADDNDMSDAALFRHATARK